MTSLTFRNHVAELAKPLSISELKDVLNFAYVLLASRKQGKINGLSISQWNRISKKQRSALGEFAKNWLAVNDYSHKENALSGQQPTESSKDGLTAII